MNIFIDSLSFDKFVAQLGDTHLWTTDIDVTIMHQICSRTIEIQFNDCSILYETLKQFNIEVIAHCTAPCSAMCVVSKIVENPMLDTIYNISVAYCCWLPIQWKACIFLTAY